MAEPYHRQVGCESRQIFYLWIPVIETHAARIVQIVFTVFTVLLLGGFVLTAWVL